MSDLPLNAMENNQDNLANAMDNNSNFTKSPIKLSMTEKRVIGGLKQLTELLFKQHYKQDNQNQSVFTQSDEPVQSDEVSTSTEYEATSSDMQMDKENDGRFQQFLDNAMEDGQGEQFCAMVLEHLTTANSIDHSEEWHRGQLDAYNLAHKRLFNEHVE